MQGRFIAVPPLLNAGIAALRSTSIGYRPTAVFPFRHAAISVKDAPGRNSRPFKYRLAPTAGSLERDSERYWVPIIA